MNSDNTDQPIDRVMRQILSDASLTDAEVEDIADSPDLRWAIKRDIARQTAIVSPWPPTKWITAILAVCVPTAAALLIGIGIWNRSAQDMKVQPEIAADLLSAVAVTPPPQTELEKPAQPTSPVLIRTRRPSSRAVAAIRPGPEKKQQPQITEPQVIKTEFIALSYARNPDSGQIVRVKVPSSMMVTLGLVQTVEKPANLIDAEVLVGDDGLTRAIRFIR